MVVVSLYEERCEEQNKYHMKKAIHVIACAHLNFWKSVRTIDLIPSPREAGRGLGRGARNLLSPGPLLHCVEEREKSEKTKTELRPHRLLPGPGPVASFWPAAKLRPAACP